MPFAQQLIHLFAAILLLLSFAMLSQRRVRSLVTLFAWQGAVLVASILVVAYSSGQHHLYGSAVLTLLLKVVLLPVVLVRLSRRLGVDWDARPLFGIPVTMLLGLALVIFAFGLAQPLAAFGQTISRSSLGIAMAIILLAFLMMITRRMAVSQVVAFLALENGLFFAATSATYGMPMVVELGIALDVLVGVLIFGVFFFQLRAEFDSLDLHHLESLKDE